MECLYLGERARGLAFLLMSPNPKLDAVVRGEDGTSCKAGLRCCLFEGCPLADNNMQSTGKHGRSTLAVIHRRSGSATIPSRLADLSFHGSTPGQQQASKGFDNSNSIYDLSRQMQVVYPQDVSLVEGPTETPLIELEVPLIDVETPLIELGDASLEFEQPSLIDLDLGFTRPASAYSQIEAPLIDMDSCGASIETSSKAIETQETCSKLCCEGHLQRADALALDDNVLEKAPHSWQVGAGSMSDVLAWKDTTGFEGNCDLPAWKSKETRQTISSVADWEISPSELKLGPKIGQVRFCHFLVSCSGTLQNVRRE